MQCPNCGLLNPASALRCDCGYDFASGSVQPSYLTEKEHATRGGTAGRPVSLAQAIGAAGIGAVPSVLVRGSSHGLRHRRHDDRLVDTTRSSQGASQMLYMIVERFR